MPLDLTKPIRTVGSHRAVRLIDQNYKPHTYLKEPFFLWLVTRFDGTDYVEVTNKEGFANGRPALENVPEEPRKHAVYVNLYENVGRLWVGEAKPDRKAADKIAGEVPCYKRLACKRVEFVEGVFDD